MRTRRLIAILALSTVITAGDAKAQAGGSHGSIYTRFVLGDRVDHHSSTSAMLGGAGAALPAIGALSLANPALWGQQDLVRLGIGAEVQGLRAEDQLGQSARLGAGHVSALQVTVPLIPYRLGATASLRPYTRSNYYVIQDGTLIEPQLPTDTLSYRVHLDGGGGLYEFQLGTGWQVSPSFSVGASARLLFGLLEERRRTQFTRPDNLPETMISRNTRLSGFGAVLGTTYQAGSLLTQDDRLQLGAAFTLPTSLSTSRVGVFGFSLDQDTLSVSEEGTTRLPLNVTAGFAYSPNPRWLFAADGRFEPWTDFESDFAFSGYDGSTGESALRDRLRIGGGLQFMPGGADRDATLLARSAYRLGAYFDTGYVAPREQRIATIALTGGVSLPALLPGTRFDIGFEAGTRGTTDHGLVRDLFLRGTATINFSERWFVRRQFG